MSRISESPPGRVSRSDERQRSGDPGTTSTHSLSGPRYVHSLVVILLLVHACLLAWGGLRHSPSGDEVSHLVAGISHWRFRTFDLYRVNPPLVRLVASLPVLPANAKTEWGHYDDSAGTRSERSLRRDFVAANGRRVFLFHTLARLACIPFSLLGGYVCFRWARELYGQVAGIVALTLWCLSPNILAHGQMITPDVAAAALGVAAAYLFWRWLKNPSGTSTLAAGLALGLTLLTKMTWIILLGLWPMLWLVWRWPRRRDLSRRFQFREGCLLATILLLGLYAVNLGYGFEGSFKKLGDYKFVSHVLSGRDNPDLSAPYAGSRFAGAALGNIPVPLPENYLLGIDLQKWDFERGFWSYLRGEWRVGGWWYYYLYALAIKVPLGIWLLLAAGLLVSLRRPSYAASWLDELLLLAPPAFILVLVSSQTGFSHHMRYVLPILPFAFIWASKVGRAVAWRHSKIVLLSAAALSWSVTSSLWVYPHSLSYFNELVGGPTGGHAHLVDSNIDWGQDLLYLKGWADEHPESRPLRLAFYGAYDPSVAGIESQSLLAGRDWRLNEQRDPDRTGPLPGCYAISVNKLRSRYGEYACFLQFEPVAMAGYSIYIYHITLDQANRVRREFGMAQLPNRD